MNTNNASILNALFVYSKSGKVKVLDPKDSKDEHEYLIADGWKHTATLDPVKFIEYLSNSSANEILSTIKGLKALP